MHYPRLTDLVPRLLGGDEHAMRELVDAALPPLCAIARKKGASERDAEGLCLSGLHRRARGRPKADRPGAGGGLMVHRGELPALAARQAAAGVHLRPGRRRGADRAAGDLRPGRRPRAVSMVATSDGARIPGSHTPDGPRFSRPEQPLMSLAVLPVFQLPFRCLSAAFHRCAPGSQHTSAPSGAGVNVSNSPEPQP